MKSARILTTLVLLVIVVIAGIIGLVQFLGHQVQGYQVDSLTQIGAHVCDAGQKIKNAADYTGQPPHKMYVVQESSVIQTKPNLTDYSQVVMQHVDPLNSAAYFKFQQATQPKDVGDTQLIACISRASETDTGRQCAYDTGTLNAYAVHYKIDVYSAKTHKLIKSTDVKSVPTDSFVCPSSVYYDPAIKRQYIPFDQTDLLKIVQPLAQNS